MASGSFIPGNSALPSLKTDEPGHDPAGLTYELDAADVNNVWYALGDVRTHTSGWVSVYDYGAIGDGVNDDTTAIQNAINANKGKTIVFPTGSFLCAGVLLSGSSYDGTSLISLGGELKIKADGGSTNFGGSWCGLIVQSCSRVFIDLRFDGNRSAMTATEHILCLVVAGASKLRAARVYAREIRGDAVYVCQSDPLNPSTDSTDLDFGAVHVTNTADDGRNAFTLNSGVRVHIGNLFSYQVGGLIGSTLEPGGLDLEPNSGSCTISDFTCDSCNITTAGTGGLTIVGKSVSGNDANRDWNINRVRMGNVIIRRTGTTGSGLSATNLIRVRDLVINANVSYAGGYGSGWYIDYADRVYGHLTATGVSVGLRVAPVGEVRDFDLRVDVSDYSQKGLQVDCVTRGRFTGRVSNSTVVSGSTPWAIQTTDDGRGGITQTEVIYSVDCPYDGVQSRGFRNETTHAVAYSNCYISDCDFSGYSSFSTAFDQAQPAPFRQNVLGFNATAVPNNGYWTQGEILKKLNSTPSATAKLLSGWYRATTGTGNTLGTDWVAMYSANSPNVSQQTLGAGASAAIDLTQYEVYVLLCTGSTMTVPALGLGVSGQEIEFLIANNIGGGGTLTTTFTNSGTGPMKLVGGAWSDPLDGKKRVIRFRYINTLGAWLESFRSSGDI